MGGSCWALWWCQQKPYRIWKETEVIGLDEIQKDALGQDGREVKV